MNRILIVGAGPAGLLLALNLKRYGITPVIIEKTPKNKHAFTKAITINPSTLKILHGMGIVSSFLEKGKAIPFAEIFFNTNRVAKVNLKFTDGPYNYYLSLPQPVFEDILEKHLNQMGVQIKYEEALTDIKPTGSSITVWMNELKSNNVKKQAFEFVIACDGGHSTVRNRLNIPFKVRKYDIKFTLVDIQSSIQNHIEHAQYFVYDQGFLGLFPMHNNSIRIVFQQSTPQLSPKNLSPRMIEDTIKQHTGREIKVNKILTASEADIGTAIMPKNKYGHIFFAGDAYHIFSPVGGQGMNTGLEDAFDLAWKLSHYISHNASEALLNAYNTQRQLVLKRIIDTVDLNTRLITRLTKNHEKLNYYTPSFKNRNHYKATLPQEFSGEAAHYSSSLNDPTGKRVPYFEIHKNLETLESSYDLPRTGLYTLINFSKLTNKELKTQLTLYQKLFQIVAGNKKINNILKTHAIKQDTLFLISPNNYISAVGDGKDILNYFVKFYDAN